MRVDPEYKEIKAGKRYVLAEGADSFDVWDRHSPQTPIGRFPVTEEGFAQAAELQKALSRRDRGARQIRVRLLLWALFIGLGIWIAANIGAQIIWFTSTNGFASPFENDVFTRLQAASRVGQVVWMGALAVLIALWLLENWHLRSPSRERGDPPLIAALNTEGPDSSSEEQE